MAKKTIEKLSDLTPDQQNFNRHTEFGSKLLEDSLRKFGAGRSILVDKNGNIIAGNGVTETAANIGMEDVIVVPSDGKKIVVVQRTDLELDSPEGRELALADNMTALKGIDMDLDKVSDMLGAEIARAWGLAEDFAGGKNHEGTETARLSELKYDPIYYEPAEKPNLRLEDCVNLEKFNAKMAALDQYNLTDKQKDVLRLFAYRFIKIDFEAVANYYAFNATEAEKDAIERLRLVLVDGGGEDGLKGYIEDDLIKIADIARASALEGGSDEY